MIRLRPNLLAHTAVALLVCWSAVRSADAQTGWIENWFRNKIVGMIENSTGGTASIQSLSFNLFQLRLDVRGFVLRGLEPPSAAPLLQADLIRLYLRVAPFNGFIRVAGLNVDRPQADVIVFPDGSTNIPGPKTTGNSDNSGLQTIVDLAIGNFDLRDGTVIFADHKANFNADGQNLLARLAFQSASSSYSGEIDISPLNWRTAGRPVIHSNIKLPLTLKKDKLSIESAQVATDRSRLFISGSLERLAAPVYTAHVTGQIALSDLQNAGQLPPDVDLSEGPQAVNLDLAGSAENNRIEIVDARLNLGQSNFEASGVVKGGRGAQFTSSLDLAQLGRLLRLPQRPGGALHLNGNASLAPNNDYLIRANLDGKNISLRQGTTRLNGIGIVSAITAQPNLISWTGLRVAVLGGDLTGSGSLANSAQLQFAGNLRNFQTAPLARAFGQSAPYSGMVSGPLQANGDIKTPASLEARANLSVVPVRSPGAIPISGRLNVAYNGRAQSVILRQSYLALPHSRIDLAGSLERQIQVSRIQVSMTTRDFADFRPLVAIPVVFNHGDAVVNATVTGAISRPRIAAHAAVTNFSVEGRPFTRFAADIDAARTGVAVNNATLNRGMFLAQFTASVGLRNWKPEPAEPLRADLSVRNGTLEDLLALAGETGVSATGALTAGAHIQGTIGEPLGTADLTAVNGNIAGEPFQSLSAQFVLNPGVLAMPSFQLVAAPARLSANATYQHAAASFRRGSLRAHIDGTQVQLAELQQLVQQRPGLGGTVSVNGDVAADVAPSGFELRALNGNLAARSLQLEGRSLGDFTASATTAANAIQYQVTSDFAGSTIRATGQTLLSANHETTATASVANLPVQPALAVAGETGIPATGTLSANASFSGTLSNPQVTAGVVVTKGSAYQQPFDRLETTLTYSNQSIDIPKFQMTHGPAQVTLSGSFTHPAGDLQDGQVRFNLRGDSLQLASLHAVEQSKPGLAGMLRLSADGAATLRRNQLPLVSELNANFLASDLSLNRKPLGFVTAIAQTRSQELTFTLNSNFALSDISGTGRVTLAGDYPLTSQIRFSNVTSYELSTLIGPASLPGTVASAAGQFTIAGPIARPENLGGELQLTSIEVRTAPPAGGTAPRATFELHNQGPVLLALNRSQITVQSAHFTGTDTDLTITGSAGLSGPRTLNLRSAGSVKLAVLQAFDPEVYSAGDVAWNAGVMGTMAAPAIDGRLQIQNASFNTLTLPIGFNNANGSIAFTGTEAVIQNLTGEAGGGKVNITGSVVYGPPQMQFRLQAVADQVHVTYPESVTTEADARLALAGTPVRSLLSGNVTVRNVSLQQNTDIASILTSPTPPAVPSASTGFTAGINFDVRIQTAPGVQFRTNLTENLEATANLTLRGTANHPGMFGRVSITQGQVTFFGARYTIDQGSIEFFNPNEINPNINIELETTTQGVTVTLTVSGPMNRLKLSYRSNPPLRFDEIVALLATGRQPTTDPVLAAYQPTPPQQSAEQQGLSALLGQGLANPVTSHLQRLFGVTRFSINPIIAGPAVTPQATLTIVQQVTPSIIFTYIQDVSSTNPLTIQMEWSINPRWSVIAQRDIYGELNLNFLYKKRFH